MNPQDTPNNKTISSKIYLPSHIANNILYKAIKENVNDITPIKLIKLVYFVYAWSLALFDRKLFEEEIEAWKYGPVIPSLYHEFKEFGDKPINKFSINTDLEINNKEINYPIVDINDIDTLRVIETVWFHYKDLNGWTLSAITHQIDSPWQLNYVQGVNKKIPDEEIKQRAKKAITKFYP